MTDDDKRVLAFRRLQEAFSNWQRFYKDVADLQEQVDISTRKRDDAEKALRLVSGEWCKLMNKE